jgi:apolipoprotein N-acyltransferase
MTVRRAPAAWFPSGLAAQLVLALMGGAVGVLAFAPFYFWPLALLSLWVLLKSWHHSATSRRAFLLGLVWGLGLFAGGVSWIYVSLHVYGGMPAVLAGTATLLFCAYLSLYPALAGALYRALSSRFDLAPASALLVLMPACFVVFELLRGWVVSGFPWLTMGYSQTPGGVMAAPLAGYAAIIGVYGISWLLAATAAAALLLEGAAARAGQSKAARIAIAASILAVWGTGQGLLQMTWSEPSGKPLRVALLQGNIEQNLKWRDDQRAPTLASYHQMVTASNASLIVMPETALPDFLDRIPADYVESLRQHALRAGADILMGAPIAERSAGAAMPYHLANSAVSIGTSPSQRYDKQHLVAFGEFVPPLFAWVYRWLQIPLADFSPRSKDSRPMEIAGHRIAINICYEDAFGREIAAQLPEAELLVNISNMAWFGRSLAPDQHAQLSQMRALETGRWMLRATNTGATAAINEKGMIVQALPGFTRGALEVDAQPLTGATPYSRWRDTPVMLLLAACLLLSVLFGRRKPVPGP